ncbi:glycoside hydrolase family 2 TIM barrel-domain containing protein [Sedimentisphaera salicampi]|uniref:Beta-galactosidase n=1 Tax=Sedimentisphaera salicampi TaxID=1941349 RepID=A0A1W6LPZ6_9BACT|nr:glycoside hydrolase family 2 TIM barrel-domain containing protein [Sedimentisphaera salicampi]ARN57850.1 Beta-galactosidase [Sedimentisphaera salicampi]
MKKTVFLAFLLTYSAVFGFEITSFQPDERFRLFNDGWKFKENDSSRYYQNNLDDSDWRDVQLPHDMGVEKEFSKENPSCQAYLPGGVCWYRKSFELSRQWQNESFKILFNGAYCNSKVWCNGKLLGERPNGFISFAYDITDYLQFGRENTNVIAVRIDHSDYADCRWYTGTGINRDVYLVKTDKVHTKLWGTYVTTPEITDKYADVKAEVKLVNSSEETQKVGVENQIIDKRDDVRAREKRFVDFEPGEKTLNLNLRLKSPELWNTKYPKMYALKTIVTRGEEVVDEYYTPFGVRDFRFDSNEGFFLNGEPMLIKGVCLHDGAGALGTAVPKPVWRRRLQKLKDGGCNAIRMSHNPHDPHLYDLCDEMGFLVMNEAFDEWYEGKRKWVDGWNQTKYEREGYHEHYEEWAEKDLTDMLLRDRNHPSIILWSIGNEIDYPNDPFPPGEMDLIPEAIKLREIVKDHDLTRPVTAACAGPEANVFMDYLDVIGFNYKEKLYEDVHKRYPYKIFTGSENGKGLQPWLAVKNNEYISSQFLWTGIDYLGEAGKWYNENNGTHSRGARCGLLDLAGFAKPAYYRQKAYWEEDPFVHLYQNDEGHIVSYSNCENVELFQGEKSLGNFEVPESKRIMIRNPEGEDFRAIGKRARVDVAQAVYNIPGEPARIVPNIVEKKLVLDGRNVVHVEIYVVDEDGYPVEDAEIEIEASIEGPAEIIGIENGNQGDISRYGKMTKKTFNGKMLYYIRGGERPGDVELNLSPEGMESISVLINSGMPVDSAYW